MLIVHVKIKWYPNTTRSYFPNKGRLCMQDGFVFREEKSLIENFGVITFDEVTNSCVGRQKVGWQGAEIIRLIGTSRLRNNFVQGCLVSSRQLSVEFNDVNNTEVDKLVLTILGQVLRMRVKVTEDC